MWVGQVIMGKIVRFACGIVLGVVLVGAGSPPASQLSVDLTGLRSGKGKVHLCLTSEVTRFLKCQEDKNALAMSVPAAEARHLTLGSVKPGTYALLVVHDENANGKLDMMMGIPREGFGFSNNPKIHMRAPRFDEVRFPIQPGAQTQSIRLRYIL